MSTSRQGTTMWAAVLRACTPATDHRFLALPSDLSEGRRPVPGGELHRWISRIAPHVIKPGHVSWGVRADDTHVWGGAYGRIGDILGETFRGIAVGVGDTSGRFNHGFAGFVAKRDANLRVPAFPQDPLGTRLFTEHLQYLLEHWEGHQEADWRRITQTAYKERIFPTGHLRPTGWLDACEEAQKRIDRGERFEMVWHPERGAKFDPLPAAIQGAAHPSPVPHGPPSPVERVGGAVEELHPRGSIGWLIGGIGTAAAVLAGYLAHKKISNEPTIGHRPQPPLAPVAPEQPDLDVPPPHLRPVASHATTLQGERATNRTRGKAWNL